MRVLLLLAVLLLALGCRPGYTTSKPQTPDLVGTYRLTRSTSESSGPAPFFDEPPLLELRADGSYTCVDQPRHNTNASAAELARAADLRLHEAAVTVSQANYKRDGGAAVLNLAQQALGADGVGHAR